MTEEHGKRNISILLRTPSQDIAKHLEQEQFNERDIEGEPTINAFYDNNALNSQPYGIAITYTQDKAFFPRTFPQPRAMIQVILTLPERVERIKQQPQNNNIIPHSILESAREETSMKKFESCAKNLLAKYGGGFYDERTRSVSTQIPRYYAEGA